MIIRIYLLSRMLHFWQIPTINICRSKFICLMISFNCLIRTLREKCPSTDFFLVRIFTHSYWIRTRKNSVFGHFSRSGSGLMFLLMLDKDQKGAVSGSLWESCSNLLKSMTLSGNVLFSCSCYIETSILTCY